MVGGVCLHTGTIPSKTLREAILYLSGFRQRAFYGRDYSRQGRDLGRRSDVSRPDGDGPGDGGRAGAAQAQRGRRRPRDGAILAIRTPSRWRRRGSPSCCAATTSSSPAAPARRTAPRSRSMASGSSIPTSCFDAERLPRELIVVGAGVIGLEYASMLDGAEHQGHAHRAASDDARFRRPRARSRRSATSCASSGATFRLGEKVVSVGSTNASRVVAHARERQGGPRRRAALHGRPPGERGPLEPRPPRVSRRRAGPARRSTSTSRPRCRTSTPPAT